MKRTTILLALLLLPRLAWGALSVSPNGRYLVDGAGRPFFLTGDAAWSLIAQVSQKDAELYLEDRAERGFNLVMVNLIEHEFCSDPPRDHDGDLPFTGAPFTTPNEAYFAHADAVIAAAGARGITVLLAPVYLGYGCGGEGWCAEIEAASPADMRQWGRFLGERYAGFDNLVWLIGGDTDPAPVADKLRQVVAGIREYDAVHLFTAHNDPETEAIDRWPGEPWLTLNDVYTYSPALYTAARDAYEVAPAMPFFLIESAYEHEHGTTPQTLRAQSYWTATSGGFGHVFGNCPIWHFGYSSGWCGLDDWKAELGGPGSTHMTYFRRLFESRRWTELVPDFDHVALTGGYGTWGQSGYASAAYAADGSSLIAYLPTRRAVTLDTAVLAGSAARAWWYDPANGAATDLGLLAPGMHSLTPPAAHDWVLVVDDDALGFPPPGTPLPSAAPEAPAAEPAIAIEPIAPNPSRGSVEIAYRLARPGEVRIVITAADGRLVRAFAPEAQSAGGHVLPWDGRAAGGRTAGAGVYWIRIEGSEGRAVRKLLRLP